jgi:hypothetical protein
MKHTESSYYVLPEGATQEEEYSWAAIEEMCRSGQFTADTRIFLPDRNTWVRAGETDLKPIFGDGGRGARSEEQTVRDAEREALRAEYEDILRQIGEQPESIEALVEAGRVASELGDREAARKHFQKALQIKPFHSRVAQEVQRRFSKTECKEFQYLRRDPPPWEEPAELAAYPLMGGVWYVAVAAAVLFVLFLLPLGLFVAGPLTYLWCVQVGRHTAAGEDRPPLWHPVLANPVREIVLPLLAGAAVAGECGLVVYGTGRILMLLTGGNGSAFQTVSASPILCVALPFIALAYLPAVLVRIIRSVGIIVDLLSPWIVVRAAIRMGQEYAVTVLMLLVLAFTLGAVKFLIGGIPVVGKAVIAAAAAYLIPVAGYVLGRAAGRMGHLL